MWHLLCRYNSLQGLDNKSPLVYNMWVSKKGHKIIVRPYTGFGGNTEAWQVVK